MLPLQLSFLRAIGWTCWDPIGLRDQNGGWEVSTFADEYDDHLLHVASQLRQGGAERDAVDYLVEVERQRMGLTTSPTTRERAEATVRAVRNYLESRAGDPESKG